MDRVVPTLVGADRPRRPGVVLLGHQAVVGTLAVDPADRVDRREVHHVEAHRSDRVEPLRRGAEVARDDPAGLLVLVGALAAREELVPRAVERTRPVDVQLVGALAGDEVPQRVPREDVVDRGGDRGGVARLRRTGVVLQRGDRVLDRPAVLRAAHALPGQPVAHPLEEQHALGEHQLDVDAGGDLDLGVVAPGADRVGPALDGEGPCALAVGGDLRAPQVGLLGVLGHPDPGPPLAVGVGEHDVGAEGVVPLPEHERRDLERLAYDRLGRIAAEIDHGCDIHDGDSSNHVLNLADHQHLCK